MAEPDRTTIAAAKRGDSAARERLVRDCRRDVYRIICSILGDDEDAEDATQDALIRMLRGLRRFDNRREFEPWLRRIAVNCAINVLRRRPAPRDVGNAPAAYGPSGSAETSDLQRAVHRALADLPERQRIAMSLFALAEMDVSSTAAAMGCAEGTVKSHLHRAREKLRDILGEWLEDW
jgi:RNA polymerase sigma-70 factor (ECF subfamily)